MPPCCHICMERDINNNTRCGTCRKCICIKCYDRISKFLNVDNKKVEVEYKCPFCNAVEFKDLNEMGSDIMILFTETAVINYMGQMKKIEELNEENTSLKEDFDEVIIEINVLQLEDRKDRRDAIKYRLLKNQILELKKKGRKTIKMEEIEKLT